MSQVVLDRVSRARTFLFVPGDRPDRFAKAIGAGAGLVILDLEDSVAAEAKDAARENVVDIARHAGVVAVRINAVGTAWHDDDVAALGHIECVVMLPKAEDAFDGQWPVIALIETARGVLNASAVASTAARLAFGSFDLAAELGVRPEDRDAMSTARGALVLASAAAGIAAPIDGVTGNVSDDEAFRDDVLHARSIGFGAKLCIHPRQVPIAEALVRPSAEELVWAERVTRAAEVAGGGVGTLDGRMIDRPVAERARRLLEAIEPTLGDD
jgi:citrate lyase subunit beta/citryl-CoA lyase